MRARPAVLAVASLTLVGLGLAGCSEESRSPTAEPDPTPGAADTQVVSVDTAWGHIHNLALDGDRLLLGTHEGLWEQLPGQPVGLLSEPPFDVMGLALAGERFLASGHPGEGQDQPADLGLRESRDGGRTWQQVSLAGEVDFHRLRSSGDVVLGLSAHDGALLRSEDAGATWTSLGSPGVFDVALDPSDPARVVATTQDGPVSSTDGGTTFTPLVGAPLLALLAWTPDALYGVATDGTVHVSADAGATWQQRGSAGGQPGALAADGDRVAVLVGDTVTESDDGGATFRPRLTSAG